tara:strand:- start:692 stop:2263 length:1572 start_codon:yes stop_codon:yes gene_type:complete
LQTPISAGIFKPMKNRWKIFATFLLSITINLYGQTQESAKENGIETVEKLQNLSSKENANETSPSQENLKKKIYVIPVRNDIMPPILYVIRRGVKEAMEAEAECIIIDMDTNGGRVDITEEIFGIINKFKGKTVTYVNKDAYSAGAFIAVSTDKVYMAPQSVIGAAAPIMMGPGGGAAELPSTMEAKMNSAIRAKIRTQAEKNGYAIDVIEAMVDKSKTLERDGKTICAKDEILTLTDIEAATKYGEEQTPLLSSGTVENIETLIKELGYADAERIDIKPLGAEELGSWISTISPLLLLIGIGGLYIEFKTPGFGVFGAIGIGALVIYFFGGYVSGLAGIEWVGIFLLGIVLVAIEIFIIPGTLIVGLCGAACIFISIIMGMTDLYPNLPWFPVSPSVDGPAPIEGIDFSMPDFGKPLRDISIAILLSIPLIWALSKWLTQSKYISEFGSISVSGSSSIAELAAKLESRQNQIGTTTTPLNPGGKALFEDELYNVITQGEMVASGASVKVIGNTGNDLIVVES